METPIATKTETSCPDPDPEGARYPGSQMGHPAALVYATEEFPALSTDQDAAG
jgi:hypothetical protein